MSTHLALPRRAHLEQLHHIFGYLKMNPKSKLFFDPQHPNIDERAFKEHDWYEFILTPRKDCQATPLNLAVTWYRLIAFSIPIMQVIR